MEIYAFDIETIPDIGIPSKCLPQFSPESVKVGNLKDQDKIDAKVAEARAEFDAGINKKMSLDPDLCKIFCFVGVLYDTNENKVLTEDIVNNGNITLMWDAIAGQYENHVPIVSYNGMGFDLPVLHRQSMFDDRCLVPAGFYADLTRKYSNKKHYDLMQILAGWDRTKWKSLNFYLNRFGIQHGAPEMDGSMVYDEYKAGNIDKIVDYCKADVLATCELFTRIESWIVE